MKIGIVGAGSIGLLLGTFFSEADMNVTMFARRKEQAELLKREGIRRINIDNTETICKVNATIDMEKLSHVDLLIIAVKYSSLADLLLEIKQANIKTPLLFIQNGIGHINLAYRTAMPYIAFGAIEQGALKIGDRTVAHNGVGPLTIGEARGESSFFSKVEDAKSNLFPINFHVDAEHILIRKALINCMINPLTAILQVKNGELLTNKSCHVLFANLYTELSTAFPIMQTDLSMEMVIAICRNTERNQSSMLSDRLAGRPMEIETIVTAVIEKANAANKSLPLLDTLEKMLYAIDEREKGKW